MIFIHGIFECNFIKEVIGEYDQDIVQCSWEGKVGPPPGLPENQIIFHDGGKFEQKDD